MFRRAFVVIAVAVTTVSLASAMHVGADGAPAGNTELPGLSYARAMVSDEAVGTVFVGGQGGLDMAAIDGTVDPVAVSGAPADVTALATTLDGSTLWVGGEDGSVVAFDATHPEAGPLSITPSSKAFDCIGSLGVDGTERVWATSGDCAGTAELAVLDPATGSWTNGLAKSLFGRKLVSPAILAIDSGQGNTMALGEHGFSRTNALIAAINVAGATPTVISKATDGAGPSALAVTPDGSEVIVGRGQEDGTSYVTAHMDDASLRGWFDSVIVAPGRDSAAMALSADGRYVATGGAYGTTSFGPVPTSTGWLRSCGPDLVGLLSWAGSTLLGVHNNSPVTLSRCDNASTAQSLLTARTYDTSAGVGTQFTASVHLAYHGAPVAGADVQVRRTDREGSKSVATLITDASGNSTLRDVITHLGSTTYQLTYAGDGGDAGTTTSITNVAKVLPTIVIVRNPSSRTLDRATTVRVQLVDWPASQALVGKRLSIVRVDSTGRHVLGDKLTNTSGFASIVDHPHVAGPVTYRAKFEGDADYRASDGYNTIAIAHLTTSLTISTQRSVVGYHAFTTLRVHMGPTNTRLVRILATVGGHTHAVARKHVDVHGNLSLRTRVNRRTVFTAVFDGDRRHGPRKAGVVQKVRAQLSVKFSDHGPVVRGVTTYQSPLWFIVLGTVGLQRDAVCIYFDRAYIKNGTWHDLGRSRCRRTNHGRAELYLNPERYDFGDVVWAFRAVYHGDEEGEPAATHWIYAKSV